MLALRKSSDRGYTKIDWLESWHSFSFGRYLDRAHMGFGPLRVINDDIIAPAKGFGTHGHSDMEIITVVLSGALQHKDSLGTGSIIRPGDVQKMSAGSGIEHSEFNASQSEACHLLQIWIMPHTRNVKPHYQQISLGDATRGKLVLAASPDGAQGSISLYQDAYMYITDLSAGEGLKHSIPAGKNIWLHVATGEAEINGQKLVGGDALAMSEETAISISAKTDSKILLFEL